ncbi:MAG: hypothetical protein MJA29_02690, partial [Candidatus Omnitrophica bacterium]|nr:hypothetical protein [Candidatus Omnitrophota bacterium]
SYPRLGGVAGRVIEEADKFTNSRKAGASVSFTGRCFRNFSSERPGFVTAGPGGNISFDRRLIEDVGLFDEKFIGTSELEETDFCYRVRRKGCRIYYNPRAVIRHLVFPSGGCRSDFAQRGYYRMHNIGLFLAKHKSPWSVPAAFIFQGLTMLKRGFSARQAEAGISWSFLLWFKGLLKGYFITGKGFRSECTAHKSSISSLCGGD